MGPDTHGKGNLGNFVGGGTGGVAVEYAITAATRPFANFIWTLIPLAYFQQMEFVFIHGRTSFTQDDRMSPPELGVWTWETFVQIFPQNLQYFEISSTILQNAYSTVQYKMYCLS